MNRLFQNRIRRRVQWENELLNRQPFGCHRWTGFETWWCTAIPLLPIVNLRYPSLSHKLREFQDKCELLWPFLTAGFENTFRIFCRDESVSSSDIFFMYKPFCRFMMWWRKNPLDFFSVVWRQLRPSHNWLPRNRIVLHQNYTILSGRNIRSHIHFKAWEFVPHVRKFKLVLDEMLAFVVVAKWVESRVLSVWKLAFRHRASTIYV